MIYAHTGQAIEGAPSLARAQTAQQDQNEARTPQVAQGMNTLGRQLATLTEKVEQLGERLSPVLRPSDQVSPEKASGNSQRLCHLAEYIDEHINVVIRLQDSLQYLYDHLEL